MVSFLGLREWDRKLSLEEVGGGGRVTSPSLLLNVEIGVTD